MKLPSDLREFIELLNSRKIRYVIVGGHAVGFHGHPRYTGDIDFFVERSADNGARIIQLLQEFGFGSVGLALEDFLTPNNIVQLGYPPNRIDLLTGIQGVSFSDAYQSRVDGSLDGLTVPFISKPLLIQNKRVAGRLQDVADAEKLERS